MCLNALRRFLAGFVALFCLNTPAATLIPEGADWKYFTGLREPSPTDLTAWRSPAFNDNTWASGPATFFYGEEGLSGTELTDMRGRYTTLYLRKAFTVLNPSKVESLQLRMLTDDGLVAWINGKRVAATNAPAVANPPFSATAPSAIEPFPSEFDISPDVLVAGENVLAIQVFNGNLDSSDLVFDGELVSIDKPSAIPSLANVVPAPGFVSNLTAVTVTFSETVTGVTAGDLLLNGVPATGLSGSGTAYTFSFAQPAFGPIDVSWGPLHKIFDLDNPPVRFDGGAPGSTWAYQLVNPGGPNVVETVPTPGVRLRRLSQVEVTFSRPVRDVVAGDLLINGSPATSVVGVGAGPFVFAFRAAPDGDVRFTWASGHQIVTDEAVPIRFAGNQWRNTVDSTLPNPSVVISEIMTENQTGAADEDGDAEDWIELENRGTTDVNLDGWSISVDREEEGQWVFPAVTIQAGGFLQLWASGKDRLDPGKPIHTNFKLNPNGDTLRLFGPEMPRTLVDELEYPEQSPNHSFARRNEGTNVVWRYSAGGTPKAANNASSITGKVDEVHFSVERGFFNAPFNLSLACQTVGASIRFTTNGSTPTLTNGFAYVGPIPIPATRIIRAAAFATDQLPSRVRTHTYLQNLANNRRLLPVLSLVTATNNLYGRQGIMEYNPRNTRNHGSAWERPVSVELIRPEDNGGFQLDAGLRVAGGDYIRGLYNYRSTALPESKYSFRLYFRGDYGPGRLNYRFFPNSTLESFNTLHLRAGMNDPSNPLLKDEFVRALTLETGITACHGTFVYLFLNGVYKGIYNPAERVDDDFLQAYHGGGKLWDVMGPNSAAIRGDTVAWNQLRTAARKDLSIQANYLDVAARMDLENFIDYLLPLVWADNDDWPHNNTRAARERRPGAKFRFYPWDAEFAFSGHPVTYDTIATTLSSTAPPWGTTDYQSIFNSLKRTREFKVLFADRVHRAFFNDGPLTDARIRSVYEPMRAGLAPSISGFNNLIGTWISGRRRHLTNHFQRAGFLLSSNAPVLSQFGGVVPKGYPLSLTSIEGDIWYTLDGSDPRVPFTEAVHPAAMRYSQPLVLDQATRLRTRAIKGTNWSAMVDVQFAVAQIGVPIQFSEIMYNPPGGDAFEYLELHNHGTLPVDLSGFSLTGVGFHFPTHSPLLSGGGRLVLANNGRTNEFLARYPQVTVAGWFSGSLDNGGERLELLDRDRRVVASVDYDDSLVWPGGADGLGAALERVSVSSDPDDPASWTAGKTGGSPGSTNGFPSRPAVRIHELVAGTGSDWIEFRNEGSEEVDLSGWSVSDRDRPHDFTFENGTRLSGGSYLRIICDGNDKLPMHALFNLDRDGEQVVLFDKDTNRVDFVRFGPAIDDHSLGWLNGRWQLCEPTPNAANTPVALGSLTHVIINEFLADSDGEDDWIELYNPTDGPLNLEGCHVATRNAIAQIASPLFIPARGYLVLRADENPGPDHLDLKLPAAGGSISLFDSAGTRFQEVTYARQASGVSMGRIPDGTGEFQPLPYNPTRGASNFVVRLGASIRISEVMARSIDGKDWIELENVGTNAVHLGGMRVEADAKGFLPVSDRPETPGIVGPGERVVIRCELPVPPNSPVSSWMVPFTLPDEGGVISVLDSRGVAFDSMEYGPQIAGRSIGWAESGRTLMATVTKGAPNAGPALLETNPVLRLNEWMANGDGTNEFVELYNGGSQPVELTGWVLTDDPSMRGVTNNRFGPLAFVPAGGYLRLRTSVSADQQPRQVPFSLDSLGETIRLLDPSGRIADTVDFVAQPFGLTEGRYPDGHTLIVPFPGSATPGNSNVRLPMDLDRDSMDDTWELLNGLNPGIAADGLEDSDSDGISNSGEFLSGTNPKDFASALRVSIRRTGDSIRVQFQAQAGRGYQVQSRVNLGSGEWLRVADTTESSSGPRDVEVPDGSFGAEAPERYYRVVTPIPR